MALRRMSDALDNVTNSPPANPSTLRVRRHRERRKDGLRLFTMTVPETVIENAIGRRLLAAEDRAKSWPVIQACYAAQLSDAALAWLVNGGVVTHEQRGDAAETLNRNWGVLRSPADMDVMLVPLAFCHAAVRNRFGAFAKEVFGQLPAAR